MTDETGRAFPTLNLQHNNNYVTKPSPRPRYTYVPPRTCNKAARNEMVLQTVLQTVDQKASHTCAYGTPPLPAEAPGFANSLL